MHWARTNSVLVDVRRVLSKCSSQAWAHMGSLPVVGKRRAAYLLKPKLASRNSRALSSSLRTS